MAKPKTASTDIKRDKNEPLRKDIFGAISPYTVARHPKLSSACFKPRFRKSLLLRHEFSVRRRLNNIGPVDGWFWFVAPAEPASSCLGASLEATLSSRKRYQPDRERVNPFIFSAIWNALGASILPYPPTPSVHARRRQAGHQRAMPS